MKTALVVGASGLIGKNVLFELFKQSEYTKVYVLLRKELVLKHPKLEQHVVDFDKLEDARSLFNVDDIFCCLGSTIAQARTEGAFRKVDFDYVFNSAKLGMQMGAKQFLLVSSIGADITSAIFYIQLKGEVEEAISQLGFKATKIFRPSQLLGKHKDFRFRESIIQLLMSAIWFMFIGPLAKYRAIKGETVAKAMVKVALANKAGKQIFESDEIREIVG